MTPQPWPRTGPGDATDGKPRFDLDQFDPAFFDRLRDRVVDGRRRGDLRRRDAVRRLGAAPEPAAGPHRGPSVPRCSTTSTGSALARSTTPGPAARSRVCRRSRRRTSARSSTRSTTCPTCCGRSPTSRRAAAPLTQEFAQVLGMSEPSELGRLHRVAVLGDRYREALRGATAGTTRIRSA